MKKKITLGMKKKIGEIIFDRGKKYFYREDGVMTTLLSDGNFITIEGEYKEGKTAVKTSLTVEQKDGEYIEGHCDCLDYEKRKNICRHIVALGMLSDITKDVIETLGTDEKVMKFDEKFEIVAPKIEEKKKLKKIRKNSDLESKNNLDKVGISFNNIEKKVSLIEKDSDEVKKLDKIKVEKLIESLTFKGIQNEKKEMKLEVEIDEASYSDYRYGYDYEQKNINPGYVFRLRVGIEKTYYIKDVIKFVKAIINKDKYLITNKIFYDSNEHYFKEENVNIILAINDFYDEIEGKEIFIRDKKGIKVIEILYDRILDILSDGRKIYFLEKSIKKSLNYEPLFIKKNDKINFRGINQIVEGSRYFSFKNNDTKIYKMKKNEKNFLEEIGLAINYLDELLENKDNKIYDKLKKHSIETAIYSEKFGDVEVYVQEWSNNTLKIKISDVVKIFEKNGQYYVLKLNVELIELLEKIIEENSLEKCNEEKSYLIDYDGLGKISEIIYKKYDKNVRINLDNSIKKARNININFFIKTGSNGLLDFNFDIENIKGIDAELIFEAIRNEKKYVILTSGELVKIANKSMRELLGIVNSISGIKVGNNKISKIKVLQLAQISKDIKENLDKIEEFKSLLKKIKEKKESNPKNINAELFHYQKLGFNWLKNMYNIGLGAILADDMGLGKTLQTITMLSEIMEQSKEFLGLVIVPTSLLHNWKEEIVKFSNIKPILVEGVSKKRKEIIKKEKKGLLITTYQSLRNDIEDYKEKNFDVVILDEAQNIKTATSQIKKAVMKLNSRVNFALTGTPVENNILELWSIFDFVLHGYLDTLNKFKKNYKEILINPQSNKIENLRNIISPFILRRTKKEVLKELPDKFETNIVVQLSQEQKNLYMSYVKKAKKEISKFDKKENNRMKILAILTKLRQICNSPVLFKDDYNGEIAKIEVLKDLLPDIIENEHRLLIFSQFVGTLKEIEVELKNQGIEYFYIDGSVTSKDRMEICNRFNGGEKQVVLISLKAGGTGLNLVGADVVVHYDPWWNIAVENQASDRAYRIGQKNSVQVIKLITEGTIEEKILKIQENKKILSENLIEGQNTETVFDMTDEEIMNLLSY